MNIMIDGVIVRLKYIPLSTKIDSYLYSFFSRFFANPTQPFKTFISENFRDLRDNIHAYLDEKMDEPPSQDNLFNNLTFISNYYRDQGRFGEAQIFWYHILIICDQWEMSRKRRIHKGSIFYFWSQFAIFQGLLEKGFFLIHSAFEEDIKTHKKDHPGTPAELTVTLNNLDPNNMLFNLVNDWTSHLNRLLEGYRNISGNNLSTEDFRAQFLNTPPSSDTLFLFTFTLARFFDFDQFPSIAIRGNFASIFELNILFDLVLVIDAFIHEKIKATGSNDWSFKKLANFLLQKTGISTNDQLNSDHLHDVNESQKLDFEKTLTQLLDGTYIYSDGVSLSQLESAIAISYCIRNRSAHNIDSFPLIRERFNEIKQILFTVLFLSIEFL